MNNPRLDFPRRSEAALINLLSEAQQQSAKILAGTLIQVCTTLERGERDRKKIVRPRWQAGYDLAMGRALATKIRTEGYNLMLAKARRGMNFKNPKNDTWILKPSDKIMSGSSMEKQAEKAQGYLQRVVDEHPGTPWAMIAKQELADSMGWMWSETFRNVNPPPRPPVPGNNNPNPPPPRDDRKQNIQRKTLRPPPRL